MKKFIYLMMLLAISMTSFSSLSAADQEKEPLKTPAQEENPYYDKIVDISKELADELDRKQVVALGQVRGNFGIIRAVRLVKVEVADAVKQCAKANPELETDIKMRHKKWDEAITPILNGNEKELDEALSSDLFVDSKKIEKYFDLIDKSAKHAEKKLDKTVLTSPKDCQNLSESMDRTEDDLKDILEELEWPVAYN